MPEKICVIADMAVRGDAIIPQLNILPEGAVCHNAAVVDKRLFGTEHFCKVQHSYLSESPVTQIKYV